MLISWGSAISISSNLAIWNFWNFVYMCDPSKHKIYNTYLLSWIRYERSLCDVAKKRPGEATGACASVSAFLLFCIFGPSTACTQYCVFLHCASLDVCRASSLQLCFCSAHSMLQLWMTRFLAFLCLALSSIVLLLDQPDLSCSFNTQEAEARVFLSKTQR